MTTRNKGRVRRVLAISWLSIVACVALVAPWLPFPFSPDSVDLTQITQPPFLPPSIPNGPRHWLGTDGLGRDVLAALVFGGRTAMLVSLPAALLSTALGTFLGSVAGFWGNEGLRIPIVYWLIAGLLAIGFAAGITSISIVSLVVATTGAALVLVKASILHHSWAFPADRLIQGAGALLAAVPRLVLILSLAAVQDSSLLGLFLLLTLTFWTEPAQLVRAELLRVRALPYIEAARAAGLSGGQILWRHALPNAWRTVRTALPLSLSSLIGLETTLSFLGVGLPPEMPSWGRILATARFDPTAWWLIVFPALALAATTLALRQTAANRIKL
jgi:peptide/nickel transport system permease protein